MNLVLPTELRFTEAPDEFRFVDDFHAGRLGFFELAAGFFAGDEPRLPRNPLRMPDPMRYVRTFCPGVTTRGDAEERTIRIEA